jgi:hypothetical protein
LPGVSWLFFKARAKILAGVDMAPRRFDIRKSNVIPSEKVWEGLMKLDEVAGQKKVNDTMFGTDPEGL